MKNELKITNLKEKLSQSRDLCPGLNEEVYALCDYMATNVNNTLTPNGLIISLIVSLEDIKKGFEPFTCEKFQNSNKYLHEHKTQILLQAVYFPQIIDSIADKNFAETFRKICKETLDFDPPKRDKIYDQSENFGGDYPEYVIIATNWWANALVNPKFDNGEPTLADNLALLTTLMINTRKEISAAQISNFKKELAKLIVSKMKSSYDKTCQLYVDYHPDGLLKEAADKAEINEYMSFPWKTHMNISKEEVTVSSGYGAPYKTLWKNTK